MSRSASSRRRAREQNTRVGDEVRVARIGQGMTIQQVSVLSGVSWSTVRRAERGDPNVSMGIACAVAEAVGLDLVLRTYQGRPPSLRDTGQLGLAQWLCKRAHPSLHPSLEMLVGQHGEAIDTVFLGSDEIVATEIERMLADFQAQYRRANAKREALGARHQRPVRLVMAIEDTLRNRAALEPHLAFIRSTLPAGTREVLTALDTGRPLGRDGLIWIRARRDVRARRG
ncbi:MAG: helix-turn-helix domain-containing protein [Chloroflexota bacterium]